MTECVHGLDPSTCATCSPVVEVSVEPTLEEVRREFPDAGSVSEAARERVDRLAAEFATREPSPDPRAIEFRERYRELFSEEGLKEAKPAELKAFANTSLVANPGNMSIFNTEWNRFGDDEARSRVAEAITYLLRGPSDRALEDRLTDLIRDDGPLAFKGFKESLLTKVLCMVEPERFLPVLVYTGKAGKAEIAESVFGVRLPRPERIRWTIGRLVVWSNDLLVGFLPEEFRADLVWAAGFLWWAKDQGRHETG